MFDDVSNHDDVPPRGIQPDHFGVLALPVAEFLAVKHGTSYLGYSQHPDSWAAAKDHPYFAGNTPSSPLRAPGPEAADADASVTDMANGDGQVVAGRSGDTLQRSKSRALAAACKDAVPLITCGTDSTLLEVCILPK
jgi:hypothetical protein